MKIAIIKLAALGDVLRTTCVLKPLHRRYSPCEIWWFTSTSAVPLLKNNPLISYIIPLENRDFNQPFPDFDLVLSLDEEKSAAELATQLRKKDLIGVYQNSDRKVVYTPEAAPWFGMSLLNRDPDGGVTGANKLKRLNKKSYPEIILGILGYSELEGKNAELIVTLDENEEAWAEKFAATHHLRDGNAVIGLNTGSGKRWVSKQLSLESTQRLIEKIQATIPAHLLLLGGPEEVERNQTLMNRREFPLIDTGTSNSLARFLSIVNLCDATVTSDSLALHIAMALKKQIVAFFGPTSSAEIPLGGRGIHWLPTKECGCFYASRCTQKDFCLDTLDISPVLKFLRKT